MTGGNRQNRLCPDLRRLSRRIHDQIESLGTHIMINRQLMSAARTKTGAHWILMPTIGTEVPSHVAYSSSIRAA